MSDGPSCSASARRAISRSSNTFFFAAARRIDTCRYIPRASSSAKPPCETPPIKVIDRASHDGTVPSATEESSLIIRIHCAKSIHVPRDPIRIRRASLRASSIDRSETELGLLIFICLLFMHSAELINRILIAPVISAASSCTLNRS